MRGPAVRVVSQYQKAVPILWHTTPTTFRPLRVAAGGTRCPKNLVDLPTPLFLLLRGVEHRGCSISQKNEHRPHLQNRPPWSPYGRGFEVLDPPQVTGVTKVFMYVSVYNSTASTWTLATPRTTWESNQAVYSIQLTHLSSFTSEGVYFQPALSSTQGNKKSDVSYVHSWAIQH